MLGISKCRRVKTPVRGTSQSAGLDFFIPSDLSNDVIFDHNPHLVKKGYRQIIINDEIFIPPFERLRIPSGIHVRLPKGTMLMFAEKSGLATKKGLSVMAKIVDEDYQGEISLSVQNESAEPIYIKLGNKLTQGIVLPVFYLDVKVYKTTEDLYEGIESERGTGGFGSTGE